MNTMPYKAKRLGDFGGWCVVDTRTVEIISRVTYWFRSEAEELAHWYNERLQSLYRKE